MLAPMIDPIVTPEAPASRLYLFADPMGAPVYVCRYMDGPPRHRFRPGRSRGATASRLASCSISAWARSTGAISGSIPGLDGQSDAAASAGAAAHHGNGPCAGPFTALSILSSFARRVAERNLGG